MRLHIRTADVADDLDEFLKQTMVFFARRGFDAAGDIDRVRFHRVDGFNHVLRIQSAG